MQSSPPSDPQPDQMREFAALVAGHAPVDGCFDLKISGVSALRRSGTASELIFAVQRPAMCIVAQGAKRVLLGREIYDYDASRMLVFSVDLPVAGEVTRASQAEPYLCLRVDLDPGKIAALLPRVFPHGAPESSDDRGLYVGRVDADMVDAATRLLELLRSPEVDGLLAAQLIEEMAVHLLGSSVGARVAQIGTSESSVHRVAKAIAWLRVNFSQPMNVQQLAEMVHMSASSFHQHFKAVTALSPLQFQKALRLQEARRIMLSGDTDARTASSRVGYASPSQFSREYARFFGHSPAKHALGLGNGEASLASSRPVRAPTASQ